MINLIQNQFEPNYVSPPGDTLKETLDILGMTQRELAKRTGLTPKTINEIIKGKNPITPETALQFEQVLGTPASFWNNRECKYKEARARLKEQEELESKIEWLKKMPVKEMITLGWINDYRKEKIRQLRELLKFFGVASPEAFETIWDELEVNFRISKAFIINKGALAAWLRQGLIKAMNIQCKPYDSAKLREFLKKIRALTVKRPDIFAPESQKICADCGIALLFIPELPKTGISGASRWLTPNKTLIQLSLRYKTNDQLWFSFFHEAAHILKQKKSIVFLDEKLNVDNKEESEANKFASDVLIPPKDYKRFLKKMKYTKESILQFAEEIGIHPGIIVGRLQHDMVIDHSHYNDLKMHLKWAD